MKKFLGIIICVIVSLPIYSVEFTCDKLMNTLQEWNELKNAHSSDVNWARAIADSGKYSINAIGEVEYEYIIKASDTLDISKIKEVTIDYIQHYFNIGNDARANLVQGSTERSLFFKGFLSKYAYRQVFLSLEYYTSDIYFDFKFKEDRIKIIVRVPSFVNHIGDRAFSYKLLQLDPFQHYPDLNKDERDYQAKAMINILAKCINYSKWYLDFLNANYKGVVEEEEDW